MTQADGQRVKLGSAMLVVEQDTTPPSAAEIAFPLLLALVAVWWVLRDEQRVEQVMSEDGEMMKRAREVRGQMDYLMDLLAEGEPDRGTLEQAHETLEGMRRLVAAMEEGR